MKLSRAAAPLALAALLAGCKQDTAPRRPDPVSATKPPAEARPALWRVSDKDTTIYLLGTIHVLPTGYKWQNGRIGPAIVTADRLFLETITPKDPQAAANLIFGLGQSPGLPPLAARVSPDKRAALKAAIAGSGIPPAALDNLETWAAGFLLTAVTLNQLGLDANNGVEEQLSAQFDAAGKPITGLETVRQQLEFFDTLPEADQRAFLEGVIDDPAKARAEFDGMLSAWARGDQKAIAATFDEELEATPNLRATLVTRRNQAWAEALAGTMATTPGTMLVAVGAGHLTGAGSLPDLLKARHLKVERLQ